MRILLCDDHQMFLDSLAAALSGHGHEVLAVSSPDKAIVATGEFLPDVCILDMCFPDGSGLDAGGVIRARFPTTRVLVLSASVDPAEVASASEIGAGFVRKDQPLAVVLDAIERVAQGQTIGSPALPRNGSRRSKHKTEVARSIHYLTARERQVLQRLIEAETTSQIAESMHIATSTARSHVQSVLVKLGVHSRLQAVAMVTEAGLENEM